MPADLTLLILLPHAASTLMMTGLIWFVQLVHYPLFAGVGPDVFVAYENQHTRRTTWIVAPLMLTEAVSAMLLLTLPLDRISMLMAWVGLALLAVNWLSTALIQVPCHHRLSQECTPAVITRLVNTNWIRTFAWSARGLLSLLLLARYQPA